MTSSTFSNISQSSLKYYLFGGVLLIALFTLLSHTLDVREFDLQKIGSWKQCDCQAQASQSVTLDNTLDSSHSSVVPEISDAADATSTPSSVVTEAPESDSALVSTTTEVPSSTEVSSKVNEQIPNIVNFVFVLPEGVTDFPFKFYHYLSMYSANLYWKPDIIYLHTNADEGAIERARNGTVGKWNSRIFNMPNLRVNHHVPPEKSNKGQEITRPEHMSDFVRVEVILEFGGTYIDMDVFALRDIKPLREAGFNAVLGRESGGKLNCGIFMSKPHSKALTLFLEGMHDVFKTKDYAAHCVLPLTVIGERLVAEQGEMLIVDREGFHPVGWDDSQAPKIYEVHENAKSNLEGISQGDPLPDYSPKDYNDWHWLHHDDWDRNFYASYMLHGFRIEIMEISPRFVFSRQSVFSRAVYAAAKAMYEEGLVEIDDSPEG
ncbi:hypothetical protein BGZ63DRAFT_424974 [Mariannaea sp. PMI_226]|nr:hypothetical protein BGZ63DRAFT_424974 [Mariannaea sp. PMI_226]